MTQLSRELGERELRALANEGSIHQAAWELDLALRGARRRAVGRATPTALRRRGRGDRARRSPARLSTTPGASATIVSQVAQLPRPRLSRSSPAPPASAALAVQDRRATLDATLTTAWVERLAELHTAARAHDEDVRRIGTRATWLGALLAVAGFVLAMLVARTMARDVSQPLADLSAHGAAPRAR
jgi:two-component system sensor histidine kinase GlrK